VGQVFFYYLNWESVEGSVGPLLDGLLLLLLRLGEPLAHQLAGHVREEDVPAPGLVQLLILLLLFKPFC
jgi:hypothetical protein